MAEPAGNSEPTRAATESLGFEPLAAVIPSGVVLTRDKRIVWANDRFLELAGHRSAVEPVGGMLADWFTDTGGGLPDTVAPRAVECALIRPAGEIRTVVCRPAKIDAAGICGIWVIEDVSHVRTLEGELLRVSKALHSANREVAGLRERVGRESDEREELLTVVSHELRTPVTIISGYARLLLSEQVGPLNEEQRGFLQESSKGCQRLNVFIGNLLEAARTASDGEVLEIAHAAITPVVETVVTLLDPLLDEGELSVDVAIAPEADCARFDRMRLEQILTNLLGNAIKYSPPGGTIRIAARAQPVVRGAYERECVELTVCDEGPGVAHFDRARIFEPYIQVGEQRGAGGLGLGLAICKRLVEAHGGSLSVRTCEHGNSEFAFTLPVADDAPDELIEGRA